MKILVRKKLYGNNTIMLQRVYYLLFIFPVWRDWKALNNELNSKDATIVKMVEKLKKAIEERQGIEAMLKAEVKEMNGRYLSEPTPFMTKEFWFKRHPDLAPIDGKLWRYLINPKAMGEKGAGIREKMGLETRKSSTAAYIPKDLEKFGIALENDGDFDAVIPFNEPKQNSNKQKSSRKKRPGESSQEHQDRLNNMDNGSYEEY